MVDGFYLMQLETVQGSGGGVIILSKSRVLGGDTGFYYLGQYDLQGQSLTARVSVRKFLNNVVSIFGIEGDYDVDLTATVEGNVINGKAVIPGHPEASLLVRLTKRSDLP
jgi:hypothetical protein